VNRKVSFHELAEFKLNDAIVFFEIERAGLGLRFLPAIEAAVAHIREIPGSLTSYKPKTLDVRLLRRFPYSILYSIKPDRIVSCGSKSEAEAVLLAWPHMTIGLAR
jgi:hypothetical protein